MKKEDEKDPKTWEFELSINKQINKKTRITILVVSLLLFILLIVDVVWLIPNIGGDETAIRIVFRKVFVILLSVLFIIWIIAKKVRKKYWPIIVVPVLALIIVILFVNNYPGGQIQRNDIFSFAGDYLSFLGTFCLGYFIFLQDEARRIDDRRSKVKLLLETIESAESDLLRLGNIVTSSNRKVLLTAVTYDENWRVYYHEYEALKGSNFELRKTLEHYFTKIEQINNALRQEEYEFAHELHRSYIKSQCYSISKYNLLEAQICLQDACTDFNLINSKSWIERKETIKLIEELCGKYYYIIENYIYVWLLRKDSVKTSEEADLTKEITDWLINNSPEIKEIAKFPDDKRIISKVVFNCSLMMNRKSKKVQYVWGEYSLKK